MSTEAILQQVLDMVGDLKGDVGVLQGTTSAILAEAKRTNGRVSDHDNRLGDVERELALGKHDEHSIIRRRGRRWEVFLAFGAAGVGAAGAAAIEVLHQLF